MEWNNKSENLENNLNELEEKILYHMYLYNLGAPELTDSEYDELYSLLSDDSKVRMIKWQEVDFDLIQNLKTLNTEEKNTAKEIKDFEKQTDISGMGLLNKYGFIETERSVQMLNEWDLVETKFLSQLDKTDFLEMSLKMDGWNASALYLPENLMELHTEESSDITKNIVYGKSSGKNGEPKDITELMRLVCPKLMVEKPMLVSFEIVLSKEGLQILNTDYPDKNFTNQRNSMSSFVHQTVNIHKYSKYVKAIAINAVYQNREPIAGSIYEVHENLLKMGFQVTPHLRFPCSIENVKIAFNKFENLYRDKIQQNFIADGVVLAVDNYSKGSDLKQIIVGRYNTALVSLKLGEVWGKKVHIAEIIDFYYGNGSQGKSVKALVKPVKTEINNKITNVPLINLRNIVKHNLRKGSLIEITYHSQQVVHFERKLI